MYADDVFTVVRGLNPTPTLPLELPLNCTVKSVTRHVKHVNMLCAPALKKEFQELISFLHMNPEKTYLGKVYSHLMTVDFAEICFCVRRSGTQA